MEDSDLWSSVWQIIKSTWTWAETVIAAVWAGLQWPHAVLIITIIFFMQCNKEFKSLVGRMLEVGPTGAKFHPVAPSQSAQPSLAPTAAPAALDVPINPNGLHAGSGWSETRLPDNGIPLPNPIVFPLQMKIYEDGVRHEIQGKSDKDALAYLIPRYAIYRVLFDFEEAYSLMFGGQIRFLHQLNQRLYGGFSQLEIKNMWEAHQSQFKPTFDQWTSDMYLNYLRMKGLIVDMNGSVFLTPRGKEFISWMIQYSRPFDRVF